MGVYVVFLVVAIVLVVIDGQVLYRNGRAYLNEMYHSQGAAAAANRMVSALFHLIVFGVLALITSIPMKSSFLAVLERVGFALLLLAVAHGVTMAIFGWLRARQRQAQVLSGPEGTPAQMPESNYRMPPHTQRGEPGVRPSPGVNKPAE